MSASCYGGSINETAEQRQVGKNYRLRLIATELVTNAFKYSTAVSDGTTIDLLLTVQENERRARLEVWNDGATLPPDFDLSGANGLGLQLVSMLADQLGASVSCESGDNTVFRLEFPW